MKLHNLHFNRRFSKSLYRSHSLSVGEMSFHHNFIDSTRGTPYPVINSDGNIEESSGGGEYVARSAPGGSVTRLIGQFFPYYTYSFEIKKLIAGEVGISLSGGVDLLVKVSSDGEASVVTDGKESAKFDTDIADGDIFEVTFRAGGVSLYRVRDGKTLLIGDVCDSDKDGKIKDLRRDGLSRLLSEKVYKSTDAALYVKLKKDGLVTLASVKASLVGGIATADVRPIKYEDGSVVYEGGRIFLTASERLETGAYQSILSWSPTTSDFRMEGALFFDLGDGVASNDVASSIVYDRSSKEWYVWFCAFSHGHVLARTKTKNDVRYGISIIDAEAVEIKNGAPLTEFCGFFGDEDPDLLFKDGLWHLAVCRSEEDGYHYYRFTSDSPLDGFTFADRTPGNQKTGGSFVNFEGEHYFVCGSDFKKSGVYDIYPYDDFSNPHQINEKHGDGGFRGWGSVFGIPIGTRKRYFHITFDRMLASQKWNWSYGNIYVFEAEEYFK